MSPRAVTLSEAKRRSLAEEIGPLAALGVTTIGTTDYTDNNRFEKHTTNFVRGLWTKNVTALSDKTTEGTSRSRKAFQIVLQSKDPGTIDGVLFKICEICGPTVLRSRMVDSASWTHAHKQARADRVPAFVSPRWPLPDRARARPGQDGHGIPGPVPQARPPGRAQ